jgi:hypothetical protein
LDNWHDLFRNEDYIIEPLRKSLQEDLTGQVNPKSQYSMTKTFASITAIRSANPGLELLMPLSKTEDGSLPFLDTS